jgi:putative ABC transport system substrate-binding protein
MRRRDLVVLLGGVMLQPAIARGQQNALPVIGFLSSFSPPRNLADLGPGPVHQGMGEAGFVEGQNMTSEYRWAEGDYSRLPVLAAELVKHQVAVIVAFGLPAALAAKAATSAVPIVFSVGVDPTKFGLVASLSRPGGNLTGVTSLFDPLHQLRLQMLRELVPDAALVGLLINPKNPNASSHQEHAEAAGRVLGLKIEVLTAANADEIDAAFASGMKAGIKALLAGDDPFIDGQRDHVIALAARYGFPTMYYRREFADSGGLISYGPIISKSVHQIGLYVGRILKGEKAGDLPVVQPTAFELVINMKTAKTLGLTVPQSLVVRADEVIE